MKRIIFSMIVMIISLQVMGQNKKGNWLVGSSFGSIGFSSSEQEYSYSNTPGTVFKSEGNSFSLYINPYMGKYVSDKVVVGAGVTIGPYSSKNESSSTGSSATSESKTTYVYVGIGPFARFYLNNNNPKGAPYIHVNAAINLYPGYKNEYTSSGGTAYTYTYDKYSSWNAGVAIGYEHFLNSVIGFYYALGYAYSSYNTTAMLDYTSGSGTDYTTDQDYNSHNINVNVGLAIHLASLKKK
jgi:hypothetical protein